MIKTFTLIKIEEKQVSDTAGTMTFHLTDENGDSRTVSGTTFLDENQNARGISSPHKRELPLIQNLFEMEVDETIDLEFKYYNNIYDRESNKTVNEVAYEKALEMQKEDKLLSRILDFLCGKSRAKSSTPASTA